MGYITPTREQLKEVASDPQDGPIVMLNLLRFKGEAGKASYQRYIELVLPLVEKRGGRLLYRGEGRLTVIGNEQWDEVVLMEYPTRAAFMDMAMSAEYEAIAHYRIEALEDSRLVLTKAMTI